MLLSIFTGTKGGGSMTRTVAIGLQNFGKIRENQIFYIDKTRFIKEWWEAKDEVTLIARPRRFGKTLTMSMVEQFFSVDYAGNKFFEGTEIWKDKKYRELAGTYPVIFLSFADVKETSFEQAGRMIAQSIVDLYNKYSFLAEGDILSDREREYFYSVSPAENCGGTVSITKDAQKITGFTVATDQSKQVDLLYAVNKNESKANHETSPVSVNFRHALSQIVFKAKNTNENLKVIVKGVKIANIKKAGDFTYPTQATTVQNTEVDGTIVATTQGTWSNVSTLEDFSAGMEAAGVTLNGEVETALDFSNASGALFMIPQTLTAWDPETEGCLASDDVYFLLNCQILSGTDKDIQVWPSDADETFAEIAVPAEAITWEQGKKYVYTFVFGEGAGYEPGEEENPDPTLVGIGFDVTVDEFIAVTPDQEIEMGTDEEGN